MIYLDFINQQTTQTAKALLGVKIIYQDDYQTYTGYIVETEAYLGIQDKAAHGFGGKITPKVTSLYKKGGTIYIVPPFLYKDVTFGVILPPKPCAALSCIPK